jgi:hypothetical protein
MDKVGFTDDVAAFIENDSNTIVTANGHEYFFIPYWFKKTEYKGIYEIYNLGSPLPDELKHAIEEFRDNPNILTAKRK